MFGDTIELITEPKDKYKIMNGDTKEVTITHKDKFPKEATKQSCRYYLGGNGAWVR